MGGEARSTGNQQESSYWTRTISSDRGYAGMPDLMNSHKQRTRWGWLLVLLLLMGSSSGMSAAAPDTTPHCSRVVFSPEFARDGVGFCAASVFDYATGRITGVAFYSTQDGARSWQPKEATGLLVDDQDVVLGQVMLAPNFLDTHEVFVQTSKGLFRSPDAGVNFELVDALAPADLSGDRLTPYVDDTASTGLSEVAFAWANESAPARIHPPLHLPVAGSPFDESTFVIPPGVDVATGETFAFGTQVISNVSSSTATTSLFACVYPFSCSQPLFTFPDNLYFDKAWSAPDFVTSKTIYVSLRTWLEGAHKELWRSTDAGRSFAPWISVNKILARATDYDPFDTKVALAMNARFPKRVYLEVSHQFGERIPASPPAHQIFLSNNKGKSWRRVSFGRFFDQPGARGTMWNDYNLDGPRLELLSDGRVIAIGTDIGTDMYQGPFCSQDNGRTWARACD